MGTADKKQRYYTINTRWLFDAKLGVGHKVKLHRETGEILESQEAFRITGDSVELLTEVPAGIIRKAKKILREQTGQ